MAFSSGPSIQARRLQHATVVFEVERIESIRTATTLGFALLLLFVSFANAVVWSLLFYHTEVSNARGPRIYAACLGTFLRLPSNLVVEREPPLPSLATAVNR